MKEMTRTVVYVVVAVVFAIGAWVVARVTAPETPEEFSRVGETFYPDFDPNEAALLELIAVPEGENAAQSFRVGYDDGMWRIRSHHGYPAEAEERLAQTASSVIGVKRLSLAGRSNEQHVQFNVLDPDADELSDPDSAGKRIRLLDADDDVLVDLIIGRRAEDVAQPAAGDDEQPESTAPLYYVRRPDEEETYLARIDVNVSTKFSEWIEPDLLKLSTDDVQRIVIDNYETVSKAVPISDGRFIERVTRENRETLELTREDGFQPWTLPELDEETESLRTSQIDTLLNVLDEMEILGVAPRYKEAGKPLLTADLRFRPPKSAVANPARVQTLFQQLGRDLAEKGFQLQIDFKDIQRADDLLETEGAIPADLLSENGDLTVVTFKGIVYHLHFGHTVVGSDKEIQIGGKPKADEKPEKKNEAKNNPDSDGTAEDAKSDQSSGAASDKTDDTDDTVRRYVLIRVEFDEAYYKDKPEKPVKPAAPLKPVLAAPKPKPRQAPVQARRPHRRKGRPPAIATRPDAVARYREQLREYRQDLRQYETDLKTYDEDKKEYEEDLKTVKRTVEELNARFADWYYVISTQKLKRLTLSREDLVGPKKAQPKRKPKGKFPFPPPKR